MKEAYASLSGGTAVVPLRLHLAIGSCPSSALPLKGLELKPLFQAEKR